MGYGCPDSGGCNARWASFYKQVNGASLQLAWDANNPSTYKPGSTYTIDGQRVSIQNGPTGALYKYTPHIHGNQLFVNIWNRWFQIVHPDGTLLRADGEPGIWLIYQGKRYGFYSRIAFETRGFSPSYIVNVPKQAVLSYEKGGGFDFANYSLVSDQSGNRYLLDGIYKRKIPSEKIFQELGFLVEEVVPYAEMNRLQRDAVNTMPLGSDVQSPKRVAYPTGVLVQDISTGAIGYLQDGIMHILHSGEVLRTQFAGRTWVRISHEKFMSYHIGSPVKLRDGTIVKSPKYGAKLFLISNGQRRPIMSAETFFGLGLKLENIMTTTDRVMDLHPLGKPLEAPQE